MNTVRRKLDELRLITRDPILAATILFVAASLVLFILWPLYEILQEGFRAADGSFTVSFYREALSNAENLRTLGNTIWLGVFVSAVSTIVGFLFAYADAFLKIRFKGVFNTLAILPIISPPFALSMSFIMLFGQQGFVTRSLLGLKETTIYGFEGLATVQVLTFFPVAYLVLAGLLRQIDPALEEAARNMGASRGHIFRTIILPLVRPGIANAFLLVFIQSVADFGNAMVIGGNYNTLAAQIYMQAMGNYDMKGGTALATILLSVSVLMFVVQKYWVGDKSYVTVTGKPSRARELTADPIPLFFVGVPCLLISLFILILYALIPYGSLVNLWGIDYTPTLKHYQYVLDIGMKPILDTTWLSLLSMPITGILGMVIAFLIVRKKFLGRSLIEFSSLLSMAIPGSVIGVGYVLAYN